MSGHTYTHTHTRYSVGLAYPAARGIGAITRCNLAVSDTYCSVGTCISDLKPLTGMSADQLPHRKS